MSFLGLPVNPCENSLRLSAKKQKRLNAFKAVDAMGGAPPVLRKFNQNDGLFPSF